MQECSFPDCPSGSSMKLFDERHDEVKSHLVNIEDNQKEMITIVRQVATLLSDVDHLSKNLEIARKEHENIFTRIQKLEGTAITKQEVVWLVSVVGILFTVLSIVIRLTIK